MDGILLSTISLHKDITLVKASESHILVYFCLDTIRKRSFGYNYAFVRIILNIMIYVYIKSLYILYMHLFWENQLLVKTFKTNEHMKAFFST